ncbi:hypothetical protein GOP47_0017217 [Adiantum capillus-veneris]|uniref:Uncharacterized protein n=1 Tax=Adiantum capillus-veneris TaxID=13818 RepID=A0A9D4ZCE9_ADICA|nr:hypothetical protein GOP47_0017217 [Adiantum capillus-veneris]
MRAEEGGGVEAEQAMREADGRVGQPSGRAAPHHVALQCSCRSTWARDGTSAPRKYDLTGRAARPWPLQDLTQLLKSRPPEKTACQHSPPPEAAPGILEDGA